MIASIVWRRLDVPGHDAARLLQRGAGWRIEGKAVFDAGSGPTQLEYAVACDDAWRTQAGRVRGWRAGEAVRVDIARTAAGAWTLGGVDVPGLDDCLDLDLGFTPATNLLPIRRLALAVGAAADAPAAWLRTAAGTLGRLAQRYERRTPASYAYEAPALGYAVTLEIDASGFVVRYPGLWEAVTG